MRQQSDLIAAYERMTPGEQVFFLQTAQVMTRGRTTHRPRLVLVGGSAVSSKNENLRKEANCGKHQ